MLLQYNRRVVEVREVESEAGVQWQVVVEDVKRKVRETPQLFDAVVVCNGFVSHLNMLIILIDSQSITFPYFKGTTASPEFLKFPD